MKKDVLSSYVTKRTSRKKLWITSTALFVFSLGILLYYNVSKDITKEDTEYIKLYTAGIPVKPATDLSYEEQIRLLEATQLAVLQKAHGGEGIPKGVPREPKDLYKTQYGLCYDRSRVLEKIFMNAGFSTRHVAVYAKKTGASTLEKIPLLEVASHATTEVLTKRGWLVVDSNNPWLALDAQQQPYSLASMNAVFEQNRQVRWQQPPAAGYEIFYSRPSIFIYGLYSRHGRFYPPYTPGIPDYNLRELLYNF